jgi:hypothetical protein
MYGELYQYLILHKQLELPGIGTLVVEKKPASLDVADKVINPQAYSIILQGSGNTPAKKFFHWLGSKLGITDRDAVIRFNDFLFDLKKELSSHNKLQWSGVGTISKAPGGDIKLEPSLENHSPASPVAAIKVLRENAEHMVRVGEEERSSVEMKEILHHTDEGRKKTWLWTVALILLIAAIIFVGYYFSVNGFNTSAASNQQKLVPEEQTRTH